MRKAIATAALLALGGCAGPANSPVTPAAAPPPSAAEAGTEGTAMADAGRRLTTGVATAPDEGPAGSAGTTERLAKGSNRSAATNEPAEIALPVAGELFPTRVIGQDAIVTIQRPRLISAESPDGLMMSADIEVYVDDAGEAFGGTALLPASVVGDSDTSPLILVRRNDIRFVFSGDIAARHDEILAAAGFAFSRQPELLHFTDVRDGDTIRRLTPVAPNRSAYAPTSSLALPLERARLREAARRAAVQREYERLITTPRGEPAGATPYQRYQQRIYRYSPVPGPRRGLYRGGIGRR